MGPHPAQVSVANLALACASAARGHEHQRECDLRRRLSEHIRRIGHDDAEALARFEIDVAHPYTVIAEDLHPACTGLQDVGGQSIRDRRADGVVRTQRGPQLLRSGQRVAIVERDVVARGEIALDFGWPTTGQQYLGFRTWAPAL